MKRLATMGAIAGTMVLACAATSAIAKPKAAAPNRDFAVAATPSLDDHFPDQAVTFPGGVKAWRDVVYQTNVGYRPQVVDIYVPATPGPHPLVFYIHGGGWRAGHTRHSGALADFPKVLAELASEGFTVASLEYRLSREASFPAQLQDSNAALRFLRTNAARYKIDPARVGVWGGSAGGHLTALTALACRETSLDAAAANDTCVTAAVTWYGVFDTAAMAAKPDADDSLQLVLDCIGACPGFKLKAASPLTYLDPKDPPFLLIHGEEDKTVPVAQSHIAEDAMRKAGVPVQAIYIPGVDHSFIGSTPEQTRAATLQAVNATFDFFHDKLGVPKP